MAGSGGRREQKASLRAKVWLTAFAELVGKSGGDLGLFSQRDWAQDCRLLLIFTTHTHRKDEDDMEGYRAGADVAGVSRHCPEPHPEAVAHADQSGFQDFEN